MRAGWTVDAADKMGQWTAPVVRVTDLGLDELHEEERGSWNR
jgi:hypothetical protein